MAKNFSHFLFGNKSLLYQPLFDGQQQPQGVLAFVLDVTAKVRAQRQASTLQAAVLAAVRRQS